MTAAPIETKMVQNPKTPTITVFLLQDLVSAFPHSVGTVEEEGVGTVIEGSDMGEIVGSNVANPQETLSKPKAASERQQTKAPKYDETSPVRKSFPTSQDCLFSSATSFRLLQS